MYASPVCAARSNAIRPARCTSRPSGARATCSAPTAMAESGTARNGAGRHSLSLLVRTNLVLAVSALVIVVIAVVALNVFVIDPIAEQSADDEAALLVLSAQTWV